MSFRIPLRAFPKSQTFRRSRDLRAGCSRFSGPGSDSRDDKRSPRALDLGTCNCSTSGADNGWSSRTADDLLMPSHQWRSFPSAGASSQSSTSVPLQSLQYRLGQNTVFLWILESISAPNNKSSQNFQRYISQANWTAGIETSSWCFLKSEGKEESRWVARFRNWPILSSTQNHKVQGSKAGKGLLQVKGQMLTFCLAQGVPIKLFW